MADATRCAKCLLAPNDPIHLVAMRGTGTHAFVPAAPVAENVGHGWITGTADTDTINAAPVAEGECAECGMEVAANEYHPYAACLMFKACHNSETVRANLPVPAAPVADLERATEDLRSRGMFDHADQATYRKAVPAAPVAEKCDCHTFLPFGMHRCPELYPAPDRTPEKGDRSVEETALARSMQKNIEQAVEIAALRARVAELERVIEEMRKRNQKRKRNGRSRRLRNERRKKAAAMKASVR